MNKNQYIILKLSVLSLCFYCCLLNHTATAQYTTEYPFIHYELNNIDKPGNQSKTLSRFYRKMDSLIFFGKGKVKIIHIGGSHIQTDVYPHVVRIGMQNLQPGLFGGRGLIFPVSMTASNNPRNFSVSWTGKWEKCRNTERKRECNLGVCGLNISTIDSMASISFKSISDIPVAAHNIIRIYHFDELDAYDFSILSDNQYLINRVEYKPELGHSDIILNTPIDTFTLNIFRTTSTLSVFELYGIELLYSGPGITYSALGVNGASIPSFLRSNLLDQQLKTYKPDLIIISLGTNDGFTKDFNQEVFKQNYINLLEKTKGTCPDVEFLLTVPNDVLLKRRYTNKNTILQENVINQLAESYNCGVWNFFRIMGGPNSVPAWFSNGLMQRDRVHFTVPGYMIKGELLLNAILESYYSHLSAEAVTK